MVDGVGEIVPCSTFRVLESIVSELKIRDIGHTTVTLARQRIWTTAKTVVHDRQGRFSFPERFRHPDTTQRI